MVTGLRAVGRSLKSVKRSFEKSLPGRLFEGPDAIR